MIPLILGTVLALSALAYVLAPLFMDHTPQPVVAVPASGDVVQAVCSSCGPRPEDDATYCSACGRLLGGPCPNCGEAVDQPGARFCAACGIAVAG